MPDRSVFSWSNIGVSLAGGLAAAAVFAVLFKQTLPGLLLAHLAPLPIMIVALGFGLRHGWTSAIVATALTSLMIQPQIGFGFAFLVAAPAMLACWAASGAPWGGRDLLTAHLPGWACLAAAAMLALAIAGALAAAALQAGTLDAALNPYQARVFILLEQLGNSPDFPAEMKEHFDPKTQAVMISHTMPALLGFYVLLMQTLNLWVSARLARLSGLLTKPWPDIAREFVLPRAAAIVFGVGLALSFFEGLAGAVGLVVVSTLGLALALQGFAVTHELARGSKSGAVALSVLYFVTGLLVLPLGGLPLALFALLGVGDTVFSWRARRLAAAARNSARSP